MYLVAFDFDSTLIEQEIIDELAVRAGKGAEVAAITQAAMAGVIPYEESLRRRVAALSGLTEADLQAVADAVRFRPGFEKLVAYLKSKHAKIAIISGTFACMVDRLPHRERFDAVHTNDLVLEDGRLTGDVVVRVTSNKGDVLAALQKKFSIPKERTVSVGDGSTDVAMFKRSAFSVALNAKDFVKTQAVLALDAEDLGELVPHLEKHFFRRLIAHRSI
ncbi:phosphoserine phosphatase SerB [Candidatus Micrarchaeota archaeon]|nr:phosphoserine phosphatase SerB [Candidatus Micrarchaeota archaeon]